MTYNSRNYICVLDPYICIMHNFKTVNPLLCPNSVCIIHITDLKKLGYNALRRRIVTVHKYYIKENICLQL